MYIGEVYETQGSRLSKVHNHHGRSSTAMLLLLLANSGETPYVTILSTLRMYVVVSWIMPFILGSPRTMSMLMIQGSRLLA